MDYAYARIPSCVQELTCGTLIDSSSSSDSKKSCSSNSRRQDILKTHSSAAVPMASSKAVRVSNVAHDTISSHIRKIKTHVAVKYFSTISRRHVFARDAKSCLDLKLPGVRAGPHEGGAGKAADAPGGDYRRSSTRPKKARQNIPYEGRNETRNAPGLLIGQDFAEIPTSRPGTGCVRRRGRICGAPRGTRGWWAPQRRNRTERRSAVGEIRKSTPPEDYLKYIYMAIAYCLTQYIDTSVEPLHLVGLKTVHRI